MRFGANHYVPVLKLKRGEKKALERLSDKIRAHVTPILEVVQRSDEKTVADHIHTTLNKLGNCVVRFPRYFLDCIEIEADGPTAAQTVFERAAGNLTPFTPVTGLSRTADVAAAMAHREHGVAVRLTREEFEGGRVARELPSFLGEHKLAHEDVDLIVDLGAVNDMVTSGIEALTAAFLDDVPHRDRWRTLTISSSAFPKSMAGVDSSSHELVDRAEWLAWRDGLHQRRSKLDRLPTFSDCAIQHPSGVEGFNFRLMEVSAAIRNTFADSWLLLKGVSTERIRPSVQFPSLAIQLVYGDLSPHFAGADHCEGCAGMKLAADGAPKFGSAEAWRRLGTIHHITVAAEQIAGLPWP